MKSSLLVVLAGCVALAGCSTTGRPGTATKYRPAYIFGGYSEKEIEPGVWRVVGRSNGVAERGFGRTMAAYRAAELLSSKGFTYVQVLNQKGKATSMGYGGTSMVSTGEEMILTVRGANSPERPVDCRAKDPKACMTFPAAAVMARLRPLLHIGE